ncbi:MAG: 30S ribosomal protein S16 [Planctomycetota bacterium]
MSTIIRMSRTGRTNMARFRIVVADTRMKRDGRFIEVLGTLDPHQTDLQKKVTLKPERITHWLSAGALPSKTVAQILTDSGILKPKARVAYRRKQQRLKKKGAAKK